MAVSVDWGSFSWVSLYQEPNYLGSIFGTLIVGNFRMAPSYGRLPVLKGFEVCASVW